MWYLLLVVVSIYASEISDVVVDINSAASSALGASSSLDTPVRDICDEMIYYYFKGNGIHIRDQIKPYLQQRLASPLKKKKLARLDDIELKRASTKVEPEIEDYINKKVSRAIEDAFQEEYRRRIHYQEESHSRLTKPKAAIITAITSLVTAGITAGVTLAITFGT